MVPEFLAAKLATPIHLALTYDEEVGCLGVRGLIAALADRPCKPRLCIIGEPTLMQPVDRAQGQAQPALPCPRPREPFGAGPCRRQRDRGGGRDRRPYPPHRAAQARRGPVRSGLHAALHDDPYRHHRRRHRAQHRAARMPLRFRDPPPARRRSRGDLATSCAGTPRRSCPRCTASAPPTGIDFEEINAIPALATRARQRGGAARAGPHRRQPVGKVSFGTEGGLYQQAGIPTVICGPGSIEHGA